mgnify:FL=1
MYIYILELQNNKFYLNLTNKSKFTLSDYENRNGYQWTYQNLPMKLEKIIPYCDKYDLDKYVLIMMQKYGINNVRGGSFSELSLDYYTVKFIRKMICNVNNLCDNCGHKKHDEDKICHWNDDIFIKKPIKFDFYNKNRNLVEGVLYFQKNDYEKINLILNSQSINNDCNNELPLFNIKLNSDKILEKHPNIIEILENIKKKYGYYTQCNDIFRSDCVHYANETISKFQLIDIDWKYQKYIQQAIYYQSLIYYYKFIKKQNIYNIDKIRFVNFKHIIKRYGQTTYFIRINSNFLINN